MQFQHFQPCNLLPSVLIHDQMLVLSVNVEHTLIYQCRLENFGKVPLPFILKKANQSKFLQPRKLHV
jgi:hypothetical protein